MSVSREEMRKGVEEVLRVLDEKKFPYEKREEDIKLTEGKTLQLRTDIVRYVVDDLGIVLEVLVNEKEGRSRISFKFNKLIPTYKWLWKDRNGNIIQYKVIDSIENWRIKKELKDLYGFLNKY